MSASKLERIRKLVESVLAVSTQYDWIENPAEKKELLNLFERDFKALLDTGEDIQGKGVGSSSAPEWQKELVRLVADRFNDLDDHDYEQRKEYLNKAFKEIYDTHFTPASAREAPDPTLPGKHSGKKKDSCNCGFNEGKSVVYDKNAWCPEHHYSREATAAERKKTFTPKASRKKDTKGGEYLKEVTDWRRMCRRCHNRKDFRKDVCTRGHKMEGDNVYVKPNTTSRGGHRECLACKRELRRNYWKARGK